MKSFNDTAWGIAPAALALGLAATLAGCGMVDGKGGASALPVAEVRSGPAADYPVVIGEPYRVDDVLYTPTDTLNYDEVGYATLDTAGGEAVTAAHHTLPVPSYVEVTSLTTGRTILVRLERRGPMDDTSLIALSPGAAEQLGAGDNAPVRVRRVNPPEPERAALRQGGRASDRLETPETLLAVLRRKLPEKGSVPLAPANPVAQVAASAVPATSPSPVPVPPLTAARPSPAATTVASLALPPLRPSPTPVSSPAPAASAPQHAAATPVAPPVAARPAPPAAPVTTPGGAYVVQAGAYSTADRAQKVANVIGGSVSRTGKLYRVRTGPFASRTQAEASLAKVKAAGYSEARIFTNG